MDYIKITLDKIDQVMDVIEDARALLKEEGNGQWQFGYPNRDDLINDINQNVLYGFMEDDIVVAVCAITYYEEAYMHLYEGNWLSAYPYMVMHRVAVKKEYRNKGYGHKLFELFINEAVKQGYHSLRIDTHKNNHLLIHLMEKYGFVYCGKAILPPNKDRVMYEKLI